MRTPNTVKRSGGKHTIIYRDVKGYTHNAVVEGGSGTSLNLYVPHLTKVSQHKTGIAKSDSKSGTNVWFAR